MTKEQSFLRILLEYTPISLVGFIINDGFLVAPASTKYHLNYKGGLLEHSLNVKDNLLQLTYTFNLQWQNERSPYIIGLLHDICKYDNYIWNTSTKEYEYNAEVKNLGHGDRSVKIIEEYMELTEEEEMCIKYHMGAFTEKDKWSEYTEAIHKYPNVLWTHTADMMAAHIDEIQTV